MKKTIIILVIALVIGGGYVLINGKGKTGTGYKPIESSFPLGDNKIQNTVNKNETIKQDNGAVSSQSSQSSSVKTNSSRTVPVSGQAKPPVTDTASINNLSKLESELGGSIDFQEAPAVDENISFELGL